MSTMNTTKKVLGLGAASALALAGMGQGLAMASSSEAASPATDVAAEQVASATSATSATAASSQVVESDTVEGSFSFTQGTVSSNEWIVNNISTASKYLCGARASEGTDDTVDPESWVLTVDGDVDAGYSATIGDLASTDAVQSVLMGCACGGNQTDGRAVANALVKGISALTLVEMAQPAEGANTVIFTSADGYQIALPLSYLTSHYCPLVFDVNGSPLQQSVGGTNQLWLGSTPASYFARDVVAITIEQREVPPVSPTSEEARAAYADSLPNVGVLLGGEVS